MKITVAITCPYCTHTQKLPVDTAAEALHPGGLRIVHCEGEEGGCDSPYVVKVKVDVEASTHAIPDFK